MRINSAKDDSAGLAISTRLRTEISSISVASRNAKDAQSLMDTADGSTDEIQDHLLRIRELAVQAKNGIVSASDISALNNEADQRISDIDRIVNNTTWAGHKLLDGDFSNQKFQIGATAGESITASISNLGSSSLGLSDFSLNMASGSSSISGSSAHDHIQGDSLNNTITAGVGNDVIDGRGGDDIAVFSGNYSDFSLYKGAYTTLNVMGNHTSGAELGFEIIDGDGTVFLVSYTPGSTATQTVAQSLANATFKDTNGNSVSGHGFILSKGADASIHIRKTDETNFSVRWWSSTDSNTRFGFEGRIYDGFSELTSVRSVDGNSNGQKFTVVVGDEHGNGSFASKEKYGLNRLSQVEWIKFDDGYYEVSTSTFSSSPFTPTLLSGESIALIDEALKTVSTERGTLGAFSNRLDSIIRNIGNLSLQLKSAYGKIVDTDFSTEMIRLTKRQIIQNAANSILAQGNANKEMILTLIR
jgi:flagellin